MLLANLHHFLICALPFCLAFGWLHTWMLLEEYESHGTELGGFFLTVNYISHHALTV